VEPLTFVLIHGAWHGAWCWERFIPEIEAHGHRTIAIDLPIEDGTATFDTYADVVAAALTGSEDVVLVAHSLGAMVTPIVAARRPVRAMVFVCGVMPLLGGKPWDEGPPMEAPGVTSPLVRADDGSVSWPDVGSARAAMYNTSDQADGAWCFSRLRAQNSSSLWGAYPLATWPDAPAIMIGATEDRLVTMEWTRYTAQRLGIELAEIGGDHSPFLGRAGELAGVVRERLGTVLAG
jgi:pimeloyl-ACP methyl ester carboxylesterase